MKETDFKFYDGLPFKLHDIVFPWLCTDSQAGGCLAYEIRRQIFARQLEQGSKTSNSAQLSQLRDYWLNNFKLPWNTLSPAKRDKWHTFHSAKFAGELTKQRLPLWQPEDGAKDPQPDWPGKIYSIKIDWDLSPDDLIQRFTNAIRHIHPRPKMRTLTTRDALTAIAAQRILDLRGACSVMAMVDWVKTQVSLKEGRTAALFSSELNVRRAAKRYEQQAAELKIGYSPKGDFDIVLQRLPHR
jgi:hypothetical protein